MKLDRNFLKSPSAASVVTAAAFTASAEHIISVVSETNPIYIAWVYPIGIDVLMYVGIRALQARRWFSGTVALLIGAAYSFLFNADAENALKMDPFLIAASMPLCFLASILIESTAKKVQEIEPQIQTVTQTVYPTLLPIVPFESKPIHAEATIEKPAPVAAPEPKPAIASGRTTGPVRSWDTSRVVHMIMDGRVDELTPEDVSPKQLQRTKRIVRLLQEDSSRTNHEIQTAVSGVGLALITSIRAAMEGHKVNA